jgi:hypothetical protein
MSLRAMANLRFMLLAVPLVFVAAGALAPARADDMHRLSILEENDSLFFNSDKHYTQGLRLSYLTPDLKPGGAWNDTFNLLANVPTVFAQDGTATRRYALLLGQSVFTPKNLTLKTPSTHDRPYGGWLYGGASLLQETNHSTLENFEIDAGVVGPGSLAKQVQNDFHQFIGDAQAKGWADQIQNEPGLMLSYERLWRMPLIGDGNTGVDIVPQVGGTAGNVFTYADIGGQIRIGTNLHAEYGPVRIRPALSGTDYFDANQLDGNLGFYFFMGVQGRAMGRNIFLQGNTFRQSPSVGMKPLVADLQAGFSLFWSSDIRFTTSVVRRTEEFQGQATPDEICTGAVAFSW